MKKVYNKTTTLEGQKKLNKEEHFLTDTVNVPENFENLGIVIFEKLKGIDRKIVFDGNKFHLIYPDKTDIEKNREVLRIINTGYIYKLRNLANIFEKVPFNAWFIITGADIYFYDIYINGNWVDYDTLEEVMKESNLPLLPIIYKGEYEKTLINDLIQNTDKKYILRTVEEYEMDKKRMNYIFPYKKEIKNPISKKIKSSIKKELKEQVERRTLDRIFYTDFLERRGLNINTSKLSDILRILTFEEMRYYNLTFKEIAKKYNVEEKFVEKKFKGVFPKHLRKIINR